MVLGVGGIGLGGVVGGAQANRQNRLNEAGLRSRDEARKANTTLLQDQFAANQSAKSATAALDGINQGVALAQTGFDNLVERGEDPLGENVAKFMISTGK